MVHIIESTRRDSLNRTRILCTCGHEAMSCFPDQAGQRHDAHIVAEIRANRAADKEATA